MEEDEKEEKGNISYVMLEIPKILSQKGKNRNNLDVGVETISFQEDENELEGNISDVMLEISKIPSRKRKNQTSSTNLNKRKKYKQSNEYTKKKMAEL